jgi:hypothetical protein
MGGAVPYRVDQIVIDFEGEGAGEGEFTWGQREWWTAMLQEDYWWPLGGIVDVSDGRSLDDLVDELRYRLCRYPALRTHVVSAANGRPRQIVSAAGSFALEVVEAGGYDPLGIAESLHERYTTTALDHAKEWPMRMGVVCRAGRPTHVVVLVGHIVIDAAGVGLLVAQTEARMGTPPRGLSALEQAAWQASPAGQRQNATALRYWEGVLRGLPPHRFRNPDGACSPRFWHGEFDSAYLSRAVQRISQRTGVEAPMVFLALFAVALHEVHGVNPVVVRPMVDNRFRPGLADSVCTVAQSAVCLLDVAGIPFDEVLRRTTRSALTAYKHAYVDPWDVEALIERVGAERGLELDTACFLNNRLRMMASPADCVEDKPASSAFRWVRRDDKAPLDRLIMQIDDIPHGVRLTLHIDTAVVHPADGEAVPRRMAALASAESGLGPC